MGDRAARPLKSTEGRDDAPGTLSAVLRMYDTAARTKREFVPRVPERVSMYVCGPTPYDVPHLGHGRTALAFDMMRRYLRWRGFAVTYVSNITDIEDKIIARAKERGTTEPELAQQYEDAYWLDMERLGVERPDELPRATGFIEAMQHLIAELIARGKAYVVEGHGVYFQVETQPDYGKLSHRTLPELLESAGARVEVDERKRSPVDFALWKAAKPGEPEWPSPWGPGRPGWHIECSAMSLEILGDGFDLHGGGEDLVFPHHENEIAQAEGAGHEFARYWLHSAMVMVGAQKMAKSLGNFRTLADALDAHGPRAFRLLVLQTHYRRSMEINDDQLKAAATAVEGLDNLVRRAGIAGVPDAAPRDVPAFVDAMDDDFGTPEAVATIFSLAKEANAAIDAGDNGNAAELVATVRHLAGVLGLEIGVEQAFSADETAFVEERVAARADAKTRKDWAAADAIRNELRTLGIELEDTPSGTTWRRAAE
ncbi:MAG: cysteinyl-tRNA synthetase [Actinomycetia bacterium]|nr:cysteinyl-tRNA synthetase [Actinomycetes bacterium]